MEFSAHTTLKRTPAGEVALKNNPASLAQDERDALELIDGDVEFVTLTADLSADRRSELGRIFHVLEMKNLIVQILPSGFLDISNEQLHQLEGRIQDDSQLQEFFSSSMDPMEEGISPSADARKRLKKSVDEVRKQALVEQIEDVDFLLPLDPVDDEDGLQVALKRKRERRKNVKVVQVFPEPPPVKERRTSKKARMPARAWQLPLYVGLLLLGIALLALAFLT